MKKNVGMKVNVTEKLLNSGASLNFCTVTFSFNVGQSRGN